MLIGSNTIDVTYNDAGNAETIDVKSQMSIASDASGVKLFNDTAAPGNNFSYQTGAAGAKGWVNLMNVGIPWASNRVQAQNLVIPANYSVVVSGDYEIVAGFTLELGVGDILEIL